ncbi:teichoic acid D-Ala incorporation-associated protein DltX [Vagococcus elongatus]|uniref:Teichoic acid D-Ala incorporation-associated protein DltX n=1 Tax=Vagococcus elongatus TaxID=180344 RepID=A0A430ANR2_9ENTE|nr:teichoic acid D-Ala incorporation-associated protein DltX [Vagococcus elongatus]RSU09705.1 teichoic acid D-Ala incorporation-associated protein DltX [Vagococcus elongatus]
MFLRLTKAYQNEKIKNTGIFVGKTVLYFLILLVLFYLYHYSHVGGGSFIYNQF